MVMNTDPLHDSEDEDMADENARHDLRESASHLRTPDELFSTDLSFPQCFVCGSLIDCVGRSLRQNLSTSLWNPFHSFSLVHAKSLTGVSHTSLG